MSLVPVVGYSIIVSSFTDILLTGALSKQEVDRKPNAFFLECMSIERRDKMGSLPLLEITRFEREMKIYIPKSSRRSRSVQVKSLTDWLVSMAPAEPFFQVNVVPSDESEEQVIEVVRFLWRKRDLPTIHPR